MSLLSESGGIQAHSRGFRSIPVDSGPFLWNLMESSRMDPFLQEYAGIKKLQKTGPRWFGLVPSISGTHHALFLETSLLYFTSYETPAPTKRANFKFMRNPKIFFGFHPAAVLPSTIVVESETRVPQHVAMKLQETPPLKHASTPKADLEQFLDQAPATREGDISPDADFTWYFYSKNLKMTLSLPCSLVPILNGEEEDNSL
ncbi:uncharacterized protein LACBIDRAFT_323177 [Laccaria bicolor S238N-H82]|uniref:Predicted protein n=1 Tax=Laccaria bicolor (strain S238N-H82 / ATCC MYA-4686) TaxID=486041 RepID=B0CZD1_LACBS|nr:uncharacterized protein LACBIDRAFT_323177 [Laccaria bicolor S238N-H82]EDR12128.1 predicted protein [Laccaria bicolor S238N-H82]|eukprot:XP_001876392.1 predicted protein [Laccaria bicolor S238N-H82]